MPVPRPWEVGAVRGPPHDRLHVAFAHSPQQEVQNIFKAKHPMDTEITKAKVSATSGSTRALLTLWSSPAGVGGGEGEGVLCHSWQSSVLLLAPAWASGFHAWCQRSNHLHPLPCLWYLFTDYWVWFRTPRRGGPQSCQLCGSRDHPYQDHSDWLFAASRTQRAGTGQLRGKWVRAPGCLLGGLYLVTPQWTQLTPPAGHLVVACGTFATPEVPCVSPAALAMPRLLYGSYVCVAVLSC